MKRVTNLTRTGVSADYLKAFGTVDNCVRRVDKDEGSRWIKLATRSFLGRRILSYEEFFDPSEFENVVNNRNREIVNQLNEIVDELNLMREQGDADHDRLSSLWAMVKSFIYG